VQHHTSKNQIFPVLRARKIWFLGFWDALRASQKPNLRSTESSSMGELEITVFVSD